MNSPLPPLPPVPGVDESDARPGGRGMLDTLTDEHRAIEDLYARLATTLDEREMASLTSVLTATLTRHLSAEEQYLFPTVAASLPDGARRAEAEVGADVAMLHALRELESGPATDRGGIERVDEALRGHIRRCEDELFPALRAVCSDVELIRLGNRVEIAEDAAPTRPHPATPATPPWNKVVEPALGVVDKVRDALTRRSTRT
ncbi:MAG TPA: hemerythrin domain-containing protein [Rugosimonospora sp.]|jgi:hemerythrin-like domain-containing protein